MPIQPKDARINFKLASKEKQLIEKAALLGGYRSMTDYMMKVLLEDANKRITSSRQLIENEQEAAQFYEIMNRPAHTHKKLDKSVARYKKLFGK